MIAGLRFIFGLAAAFAYGVGVNPVCAQDAPPRASIESGALEGALFGPARNEVIFLGIPFAAPPTGDLRWKPPQRAPHWQGVRAASQFGADCPQTPEGMAPFMRGMYDEYARTIPYYRGFHTDEDCLFLSVWTTNLAKKHRQPVIVYIHGGNGVLGSAELPILGPALARKGVVFVGLNYRLGALGTLAHPALTAESPHHSSGNYGFLDVIAGLQWLKRNVAQFGGDPDRVAILGQSTGGEIVATLMASPPARGLFSRAIMQSGTGRDIVSPELSRSIEYDRGTGSAEDLGRELQKDLGIADGPDVLQQLRSKPAAEVLRAAGKNPRISAAIWSIVDGWILREQPAKTFAEGRQAHVPVLVGSTADECTVFFDGSEPTTIAAYKTRLEKRYGRAAEPILGAYPATSDAEVPAVFNTLCADRNFGSGADMIARDTARVGQHAYLYYFTYRATAATSANIGASHGAELAFLGNGFLPKYWDTPDAALSSLADTVQSYWVRFAATGDPNGAGRPQWPVFDPTTDSCLELGPEIRVRAAPMKERHLVFERLIRDRLQSTQLSTERH